MQRMLLQNRGRPAIRYPPPLIFTVTDHKCRRCSRVLHRVNRQRSCSNIYTYTVSNKMGSDCWRLVGKTLEGRLYWHSTGYAYIPEFRSIPTAVAIR